MPAIFAFKCTDCGKIHEGSPSIAFDSPWHYATLSEDERKATGKLTGDLCVITHDHGTDYFIRTILEIPIHGVEDPFIWGVWASLSEKSFRRYVETYENPVEGSGFFGWLCNRLPGYPDTIEIATDVRVRTDGTRPTLHLHRSDDGADHPLVVDQMEGISVARAQELATPLAHT